MARTRLDKLVVERGLAPTREKAQALILAGQIQVNGQPATKAGAAVRPDARVELVGEPLRYVSRGGLKLEGALRDFGVNPAGKVCLDIGASTGGFTDCLLQHGAARAHELKPEVPVVHLVLANIYVAENSYALARTEYQHFLDRAPQSPAAPRVQEQIRQLDRALAPPASPPPAPQ